MRYVAAGSVLVDVTQDLSHLLDFLHYLGSAVVWKAYGGAGHHNATVAPTLAHSFNYFWGRGFERLIEGVEPGQVGSAPRDSVSLLILGGVDLCFGRLNGEVGLFQDLHGLVLCNGCVLCAYLEVAVIGEKAAIVARVQLFKPCMQLSHQISNGNREENSAKYAALMHSLFTSGGGLQFMRIVM